MPSAPMKTCGMQLSKSHKLKPPKSLLQRIKKTIARIEKTGDAYTNYSSALKKYNEEYKKRLEQNKESGFELPSAIFEAKQYAKSISGINKYREEFISALKKMGEEGDDIWKQINKGYEGDVDAFIAAINAGIEKLAPAAEKLYTVKTPAELNAEAKKARDEAKSAAEKAASDQERNLKALNQKLQKLRDDALQALRLIP